MLFIKSATKVFFIASLFITIKIHAQSHEKLIKNYFTPAPTVSSQSKSNNSTTFDVAIQSHTTVGTSNVYYVQQLINDVPIDNSLATVVIKNNEITHTEQQFSNNLLVRSDAVSTNKRQNSIEPALHKALHLHGYNSSNIKPIITIAPNQYKTWVLGYDTHPVFIDLVYSKNESGLLELAYNVELYNERQDKLFKV